MAEFVEALDRINAVGDRSPGCLWRFPTEGGDATHVRVLDDPQILFNLTTWRSVEDLRRYAYRTEHVELFRRRREWFLSPPKPSLAIWWVPEAFRISAGLPQCRFARCGRRLVVHRPAPLLALPLIDCQPTHGGLCTHRSGGTWAERAADCCRSALVEA